MVCLVILLAILVTPYLSFRTLGNQQAVSFLHEYSDVGYLTTQELLGSQLNPPVLPEAVEDFCSAFGRVGDMVPVSLSLSTGGPQACLPSPSAFLSGPSPSLLVRPLTVLFPPSRRAQDRPRTKATAGPPLSSSAPMLQRLHSPALASGIG